MCGGCRTALHIAEREFPVASDHDAVNDALLVLEACQATCQYDWLIALALLLDNTLILAGDAPGLHDPASALMLWGALRSWEGKIRFQEWQHVCSIYVDSRPEFRWGDQS